MAEHLATVEGPIADLQFAVRTTALAGQEEAGKTFEETLLRVRDGMLDTPAGTLSHLPAVYTSFSDEFFERIDVTVETDVRALVNITDLQLWLGMLPDTEPIEMQFNGDPETGIASELVLEGEEGRVTFEGETEEADLESISIEMPSVFESDRFHLEDGKPAETVARTTGGALDSIVEIADTVGYPTYPIHVETDGPFLDISSDSVRVETSLPGALVAGEPVYNDYKHGFPAMAQTLSGKIRIETGPGEPAAFIREGEGYTLRVVLERV